jgi:hypothetical protein
MALVPSYAGELNLMETEEVSSSFPESVTVGLNFEGKHYTALFDNGTLLELKLTPDTTNELELNLQREDVITFLQNEHNWGWIETAGFLVNKFGFPAHYYLNLEGAQT